MSRSIFIITDTPLAGLKVLHRKPVEDSRGYFCRVFCSEELSQVGMNKPIAQINQTLTRNAGAVRGLHFQYPPHAETKIVSCLKGEIFDVAVDLRQGSPTLLHWHAEILTDMNFKSLLIPEGFAHGFQSLTDDCELLYLHSELFYPEFEGALNIADPRIAIQWPLAITEISDRDRQHPLIGSNFQGILL
ncbi:MAG: dTDP-4-dehydrorhamnose 3,5-epimerase family protein [Geobacteraceae bacterium]|jgi:dTDP-4-dehydrorhamnose 3,5-epimerase